jgi:ribonuclease Z
MCEFRAREAFRRRDIAAVPLSPGVLIDEDEFRITAAVLDHGIPCLAFALEEKLRVNVWRDGLRQLGLAVGPWLHAAKSAVRQGAPDDRQMFVDGGRSVPLGLLRRHALRAGPGQKIVYVVDIAYHDANIAKVTNLARDADQLFIEAPFLDVDANMAAQRRHLTARQAGEIARRAHVARIVPFHFSARYRDREDDLRREVEAAFENFRCSQPGTHPMTPPRNNL